MIRGILLVVDHPHQSVAALDSGPEELFSLAARVIPVSVDDSFQLNFFPSQPRYYMVEMIVHFSQSPHAVLRTVSKYIYDLCKIAAIPILRIRRCTRFRFTTWHAVESSNAIFRLPKNGVLRYCSSIRRINAIFPAVSCAGS